MALFNNFRGFHFIFFCLIVYSLLFFSGYSFHLEPNIFFSETTFDVRLIAMFLIAEPHFAMTLPILYGYKENFIKKPTQYTYIPLLIVTLGSLMFFQMNSIFLLLFLAANIFHVNRQSGAFLMIQAKTPFQMKLPYEISLHLFTFVCLYFSLVLRHHSLISGISLFLLANITILSIFRLKEGFWPSLRQIIIIAQGYLVFLPLAIFSDMLLAFAIGISIHYLQYLSISWKLCKVGFGFSMKIVLLVLLTYTVISSSALAGFISNERISLIILIPTMMQLLHFYYDSLVWQRKDPIVAEKMLKVL
jgi:hypothetical protein|tara:strand:+ start:296 stop:1207 length:912 start_codon:yes stop_codon:yes gene_type:complete